MLEIWNVYARAHKSSDMQCKDIKCNNKGDGVHKQLYILGGKIIVQKVLIYSSWNLLTKQKCVQVVNTRIINV